MGDCGRCFISARTPNTIVLPSAYSTETKTPNNVTLPRTSCKIIRATVRKSEAPPYKISKKTSQKAPRRRLITVSTSDGRWNGKWYSDYILTLQQLQLQDLAEDGHGETQLVSVTLCIEKHAGFGLSVEGKVFTSFTRKCCNCSSPFCRKIDASFNVWILPSSRKSGSTQLPEIGSDDPSVIYVKPGSEADLDSIIQDTIRLATSETCSDSCEKSEPMLQSLGSKQKAASIIDGRWSRLIELRNEGDKSFT